MSIDEKISKIEELGIVVTEFHKKIYLNKKGVRLEYDIVKIFNNHIDHTLDDIKKLFAKDTRYQQALLDDRINGYINRALKEPVIKATVNIPENTVDDKKKDIRKKLLEMGFIK